jgi:hypothetical protein
MSICNAIFRIQEILKSEKLDAEDKLQMIKAFLPKEEEHKFISHKEILLEQAKNSVSQKFRLLATMNDSINIFNWSNVQYNFIGMNQDSRYTTEKDHTVEYTLEELPEVIDNAEEYLKAVKEGKGFSGSPYMISSLQLMGV